MDQQLTVSDPDGSGVTISRLSGPTYVTVTLNGQIALNAWSVHVAPGFADSGWAIAFLEASDGNAKDFRSFPIHVLNVDRPPVFAALPDVCIEQGQSKHLLAHVPDPDGDPVTFSIENKPAFALFDQPAPGYFSLSATPREGDGTGTTTVRITANDGSLSITREFALQVAALGGCSGRPPLVGRVAPNPIRFDGYLRFWTSVAGPLRVTLFDLRGRRVRTLLDEPSAAVGYHEARIEIGPWRGAHLPSGVYYYRIEAAEGVSTGKIAMLR